MTLVTQYDVDVLLAIEERIGPKLQPHEPAEAEVLKALPEVASARREALIALTESGFLERDKERRSGRKAEREEAEGGAGGGAEGGDGGEGAGEAESASGRL